MSEDFTLHLKGLPWSTTPEDVLSFLGDIAVVGGLEGVHLTSLPDGRASGECFVEARTKRDMETALSKDKEHMGRRYIDVSRSNRSNMERTLSKMSSTGMSEPVVRLRGLPYGCSKEEVAHFFSGDGRGAALFVGNLDFDTEEEELRTQLQEHFPSAKEVRIPVRNDGEIKGFAFLDFDSKAEVDEIIKNYDNLDFHGRTLRLDVADRKTNAPRGGGGGGRGGRGGGGGSWSSGEKSQTLFVKGLSYYATTDSLLEAFSDYGCEDARVVTDRDTGDSKGFGFVDFDSVESAESALQELQHVEIEGRAVTLMFDTPRGGGGRGRGGGRGASGGGRFSDRDDRYSSRGGRGGRGRDGGRDGYRDGGRDGYRDGGRDGGRRGGRGRGGYSSRGGY